jgi:hypothetical protein
VTKGGGNVRPEERKRMGSLFAHQLWSYKGNKNFKIASEKVKI